MWSNVPLPHFSRRSFRAQELVKAIGSGDGGVIVEKVQALNGDNDCFGNVIAAVRVGKDCNILRAGQVTQHHLYNRHLSQTQQCPRAAVVAAVTQFGAGNDLTLDEAGERLADE